MQFPHTPSAEKLAFFHIRIGPIQNCLEWHVSLSETHKATL